MSCVTELLCAFVVYVSQAPRASPFSPPSTHLIISSDAGEVLFDLCCSSGCSLADAEAFVLLVGSEVSKQQQAAAATTYRTEAAPDAASAPAAAAAVPATATPATAAPTARVRAGRELREQLLKVARLRHKHKIKEADELFATLDNTPNEAAAAAREDGLAKQRVRELRDCFFAMGGKSLTERVLERFLNMPEVRQLLPDVVRQQREQAADAEASKLLLETAKVFLTKIFKARGRRSDEDRNAFAAALAAMLPADLFENRRGRAAMRILGISYRQAKLGASVRGELEDRGRGWKRICTSEQSDKVRRHSITPMVAG